MYQRATLIELPNLTGANPSYLAKSATGAIASSSSLDRKEPKPVAALDDRGGSQDGRTQVIETLHELSVCRR